MSVTETTDPKQTDAVSFELDLKHSPEKVWRALTDPALLTEWLLPAVGFELAPGTPFTLKATPQPGWDGVVNCRIVEAEEQKKLSWRWIVGDIDTLLTFTLEPAVSGTRLSLVQSGFRPDQKQNFGGARYGWKMMTSKLVDLLARMP
jgi:uncharacterized protein YndB with AHSA1/START domain